MTKMNFGDLNDLDEKEIELLIKELSIIQSELKSHIIPEKYPCQISNLMASIVLSLRGHLDLTRDNMIKISSYCLVSKDWIKELIPMLQRKNCLEIMSGSGMLAKALQEEGIHVIATDSKEWGIDDCWCEVEALNANDAVSKYGKNMDYIICSWPPYNSSVATETLLSMRNLNPNCRMIYIGEMGGCCGTEDFSDICVTETNNYITNANQKFKHWGGIHDRIFLLR